MTQPIRISELMQTSGVAFGTSGARGLVSAMTDRVCFAYTAAFLQHIEQTRGLSPSSRVAVAGDLRPSTGRMMRAVSAAIRAKGYQPVSCGRVPSPAIALYGLQQRIPTIMVTGSHIPDDRNGIKFNTPEGEILKHDEQGIRQQVVELPDLFDFEGAMLADVALPDDPVDDGARAAYLQRFVDAFPEGMLRGVRLGLYGHSAVGRDLLDAIFTSLGATVERLGYSDRFIPVDTEAIRPEDTEAAARWASEQRFDSIVSTDGDSDRPLISDERGCWLRGDVAGILCARQLGADVVVVPVSCNTAVEKTGAFERVVRTRIGSPFVIEAMNEAVAAGMQRVVGYEANGGFLTASAIPGGRGVLEPLPTRDPVIVQLAILQASVQQNRPISALVSQLPARFTWSDRLQDFPVEKSREKLRQLTAGGSAAVEAALGDAFGRVAAMDLTDGLRVTFASGDIVHVRPSGNAPELRCYTEADSEDRARWLNAQAVRAMSDWR